MDYLLSALTGRFRFNGQAAADTAAGPRPDGEAALAGQLYLVRQGPAVFADEHGLPLRVDGTALVFYPRGLRHRVQALPGAGASVACATIAFQNGDADPLAWTLPDRICIALDRTAPLRHTLELLFAEAAQPARGRDTVLDRVCDVLMVQILRHAFDQAWLDGGVLAGLADRQLGPVLSAMHARPASPWQLQSLAAIACMSRTGFIEHFRNVVGVSPLEYLTRWRMDLACRLLREGVPVKVVSGQAGYRSQPAFTRAFTEHVGVSPRHWLREFAAA